MHPHTAVVVGEAAAQAASWAGSVYIFLLAEPVHLPGE